jgi:3-isopropylmalate dehydrogenase
MTSLPKALRAASSIASAQQTAAPIQTFQIAVLPGDGIGVEVMSEALRVLGALQGRMPSVRFDFREVSVGADEYLRSGDPLPASAMSACREADAILLGAMGLPHVRWPDGREMAPQLDLREQLDLYCGLRPIHLYSAADTPLKRYQAGEIDLVIVRENCEGLFSSRLDRTSVGATEVADKLSISRRGSLRLFRAAFAEARKRRRKVTLVDKSNVLPSMVFFRAIFDEVAAEYPDVNTERIYVDAAALYLVQRPHAFDVLVTENMFGDILSDLAASLVGGMGLAPSADIGDECALFQPAHGTAPDIAGRGIANPIAMILSAAMMLKWLGHRETVEAANRIEKAVAATLADSSLRTADLGGKLSTRQMGEAVVARL